MWFQMQCSLLYAWVWVGWFNMNNVYKYIICVRVNFFKYISIVLYFKISSSFVMLDLHMSSKIASLFAPKGTVRTLNGSLLAAFKSAMGVQGLSVTIGLSTVLTVIWTGVVWGEWEKICKGWTWENSTLLYSPPPDLFTAVNAPVSVQSLHIGNVK